MLECEDWESSRTFKFENMWLRAEGFLESVEGWWDGYADSNTPDFRPLKTDIRRWNREVFENLEDNKSRILEELTIDDNKQRLAEIEK